MQADLIKKFNEFQGELHSDRKYCHLRSVANFINHFDEITSEHNQLRVYHLLNDYMDCLSTNEGRSWDDAKQLFDEYIIPAGLIYNKEAGFKMIISPFLTAFFCFLTNLVLLVAGFNWIYFLVSNSFFAILFSYIYWKRSGTRVFGYWY